MTQLSKISDLTGTSNGWGFFLCARKELRSGKSGNYLAIVLQDTSGEIKAKIFQDVDVLKDEFDAGEFVKIQARGNLFNQRLELVIDKIRRVDAQHDALDGFREESCIPCAPRPLDEMWQELEAHVAGITTPEVRELLNRILAKQGDRLRIWPAAQSVHHAYRGGLLEHVLKILDTVIFLADAYGANRDVLVAGAILHDIGKLDELSYGVTTEYSVEGNLIGHITMGASLVRETAQAMTGFPYDIQLQLEHLVLSHHGAKAMGSPVEPMTVEAFILAAADDLDAKIHQVHKHIDADDTAGPFTSYHRRFDRVLYKGS
ncbi:MAG: HD domain-containing protein [Acidobacteria bacterium]|jgi:3'-5' exoribonuclease|nr:HD domain-containing protein [Acidobacteriota bacterium]